MHVSIDSSPLVTGHKFRGTGFYVKRLIEALGKYFPENKYSFFTRYNEIPKDADIIHIPYFDPFSLTVPFKNSKKTVVSVLDLAPIIFPKLFPAGIRGSFKWQIQKRALKQIAGIITLSNSSKHDIERITNVPAKKICATYLAAGEEFKKLTGGKSEIARVSEKYHLPDKFALYVGDITPNKNVPRILQAAIDAKIPLVMVGKALVNETFDKKNAWNFDLIKVQKLSKEHDNIVMLGFVPDDDLVVLYNIAKVFVMPSIYEGFGLPVIEAMQCGCPVITSKEGSLSEVAGAGAYFVDAFDINNIAKGLSDVFSNAGLQKELSKKGNEQAKKFSWKKTAEETVEFYETLL